MKKATQEEFVVKSRKAHGDTYGYDNAVYIDNKTEVMITCKIHGDFPQQPVVHYGVDKCGCPDCGDERGAKKRSLGKENFEIKANDIHGEGTYNYYNSNYVSSHEEIEVLCNQCDNVFPVLPCNHLYRQSGCPNCAPFGFKPDEPAIFYYLKDTVTGLYKTGITNRTIKERFSRYFSKDKKELIVLHEESFECGRDAKDKEQSVLEEFSEFRVDNSRFNNSQGGYTEFFSRDILNLDKEVSDEISSQEIR